MKRRTRKASLWVLIVVWELGGITGITLGVYVLHLLGKV